MEIAQGRGIQLDNLFVAAKKIDNSVITDNGLKSLAECGDTLAFLRDASGKKRLHSANFCRNRLCPMCNWRRSLKMYSQVSQITDRILDTKKARFIFVTLTVRNPDGAHLAETLDLMNKGFKYITSKSQTFAPAKNSRNPCRAISKPPKSRITAKRIRIIRIFIAFSSQTELFSRDYITKDGWIELWQKH